MTADTIPWPENVIGYDGAKPPMPTPPVRTSIGYHCWMDVESVDGTDEITCWQVEYFVLPDGSAEVVHTERDADRGLLSKRVERYPAGAWAADWSHGSFGSRGGQWITGDRRRMTVEE